MRLTKQIIALSAIVLGILSIAAYEIFSQLINTLINNSGECPGLYGARPCNILGFEIPRYWYIVTGVAIPVSLPFGIFCASVLSLALTIKMQQAEHPTESHDKE